MAAAISIARPIDGYRLLLGATTLLALAVIGLGAYVRLSDAGLGCPDWPGCYGQLVGVPETAHDPVRAWKEMLHRYLAGTLGLAIFTLAALAWRRRIRPLAASLLAVLVVFQALLGMWTVTLLLKPVVVTAHLLGGMATLGLLVRLQEPSRAQTLPTAARPLALAALVAVGVQIALGGWVSSNYAAIVCGGFPACRGELWPELDFAQAFSLARNLDSGLSLAALTAIHWSHRLWAAVVLTVVAALAWQLWRIPAWRGVGVRLAALLLLQLGLGIANVLFAQPLPLAVAHTLGAALLLAALVNLENSRPFA